MTTRKNIQRLAIALVLATVASIGSASTAQAGCGYRAPAPKYGYNNYHRPSYGYRTQYPSRNYSYGYYSNYGPRGYSYGGYYGR